MNFAVVPWTRDGFNNALFDIKDRKRNRDDIQMPWYLIREQMKKDGHRFDTADLYRNLGDADIFLFLACQPSVLLKLLRHGWDSRTVYFNSEPEVVEPMNGKEGMKKVLKRFHYAMTWNEELVDNRRIWKRITPYDFRDRTVETDCTWENKKLLVNISGAKSSEHPLELYSERLRVIQYFEYNHSGDFSFYGQGWEKGRYRNYCGEAENKAAVYAGFRFALALENMKNARGYITEKIFDCFTAGIVPVYWGGADIERYIPRDCYIPYESFSSTGQLYQFLKNMSRETYQGYLDNIRRWLDSQMPSAFSPQKQYECIMALAEHADADFHVSKRELGMLQKEVWMMHARRYASKWKRRLIRRKR